MKKIYLTLCLTTIFCLLGRQCFAQHIDTVSGRIPLCQGKSVTLRAPAGGGASYQWFNNGAPIPGTRNCTVNGIGLYTVTYTVSGSTKTLGPVVINNVYPNPSIDSIYADSDTICSGIGNQFHSHIVGGTPGYSYLWTFTGGATSTNQNPFQAFISYGCSLIAKFANLLVTDVNGCTATDSISIKIKEMPDFNLSDSNLASPFSNCDNNPDSAHPNFRLTLNFSSPNLSCIQFPVEIDFGDGVTSFVTNFPFTHTYTQIGAFTLNAIVKGINNCQLSKSYLVSNVHSPAGGLSTLGGTTGICTPGVVQFVIEDKWTLNSVGTKFYLDFKDGTIDSFDYPINTQYVAQIVSHDYKISSCPLNSYTAVLTVKNSCPQPLIVTASNIQINQRPKAFFKTNDSISCVGHQICFVDSSFPGTYGYSCTPGAYTWDFGDGSPTSSATNPCHVYTSAGNYTVSLSIYSPCSPSVYIKNICISDTLTASFTKDVQQGCMPLNVHLTGTTLPSLCGNNTYKWVWSYAPTSGCIPDSAGISYLQGTSDTSLNPVVDLTTPGIYSVSFIVYGPGGCLKRTLPQTIKVQGSSVPKILNLPPYICIGDTIYPFAKVVCDSTPPILYNWGFISATSSSSTSANPWAVYNTAGIFSVILHATGFCPTPGVDSAHIEVKPNPTLIIPGNISTCAGQPISLTFSTNDSSAQIHWTNNNTAIGLANSGYGNINFIPINNGTKPDTSKIVIELQGNPCKTIKDSLLIIVYPSYNDTDNVPKCFAQLPYTWPYNGHQYFAAGCYPDSSLTTLGCPKIKTLCLTLSDTAVIDSTVRVCRNNLPFNYEGVDYFNDTSLVAILKDSVGCPTKKTFSLIVKPTSTSTTIVLVCPAQMPYTWNGNTYNTGGTYNVTLVNAAKCDSVATLVLGVKAVSASTTTVAVCPAQLPYKWNGSTYNTSGTYKVTLVNAANCDSVATLVLYIKATSSSITNANICFPLLPYIWNGHNYTVSASYVVILTNSVGCDSFCILNLTVNLPSKSTTNVAVCPSSMPYHWNGNTYTTAGTYVVTLLNSVGCDSVAKLNLAVKGNSVSTTNVSVCSSAIPYKWNGNSYNTPGTYVVTLVNSEGCDSIATLILKIKATSSSITNLAVCPSAMPYNWNGNIYNTPGTYSITLVNSVGCDSLCILNLSIKTTSYSTTNVRICPAALPYQWNGNSYNAAGTYTVRLMGTSGCDSVAILELFVKLNTSSTTNASICFTQLPFLWNGSNYYMTGTYTKRLVNSAGCDSIAALNLFIDSLLPNTPSIITNSPICSGETLRLSASSANTASYSWTLPNGQTMSGQTITFNNTAVNQAGLYSVIGKSIGNCKSTFAITRVNIIPKPTIDLGPDIELHEGDSFILKPLVFETGLSYKWSPNLYFTTSSSDTIKNPRIFGYEDIQYSLTVTQNGQCSSTDFVLVKILPTVRPIFIPNVFSPNDDGVNDVWVIRELATYPEATVDVFTRYGENVFSSVGGYRHPWNGTYKGNTMPVGTYYYIISTKPKSKPYKGWVQIVK